MADINPAYFIAVIAVFTLGSITGIWFESVDTADDVEETTCVTYISKTGGFGSGPQDCDRHVKKWCMDLNNDSRINTGTECGAETLHEHFQGRSDNE